MSRSFETETTGSRIFERLILIILLFAALLISVRLVQQRSSLHGDPRVERAALHDARDEGRVIRLDKLKRARKYTRRELL